MRRAWRPRGTLNNVPVECVEALNLRYLVEPERSLSNTNPQTVTRKAETILTDIL